MYYLQVQLVWGLHACGHQTILIINVSHLEGVSGKRVQRYCCVLGGFSGGQMVDNLAAMQETRVRSLGWGKSPRVEIGNPL